MPVFIYEQLVYCATNGFFEFLSMPHHTIMNARLHIIVSLLHTQVTLHSNMQKVIELSQSVVVEKALFEKFEEFHRSTSVCTNMCSSSSKQEHMTTTASTSSMSSSITTATEYANDAVGGGMRGTSVGGAGGGIAGNGDGGGSGGGGGNVGRATKSISMSTFETKRTLTTLSNSSSSCSSTSTIIRQQKQQQQHEEQERQRERRERTQSEDLQSPGTPQTPEMAKSVHGDAIDDGSNNNNDNDKTNNSGVNRTEHHSIHAPAVATDIPNNPVGEEKSEVEATAATEQLQAPPSAKSISAPTEMENVALSTASRKANTVTTTLDTTAPIVPISNEVELAVAAEVSTAVDRSTVPSTPLSPTSPLPIYSASPKYSPTQSPPIAVPEPETLAAEAEPSTPSALNSSGSAAAKSQAVICLPKQIKVQPEKDCTVPYNIINNYFSVGVVSLIFTNYKCIY